MNISKHIAPYNELILVDFNKEEILPALDYAKICFSGNRTNTQYQRGMINSQVASKTLAENIVLNDFTIEQALSIPSSVGKISEMAFGKLIDKSPDFSYHINGDFTDFTLNSRTIDIKTTTNTKRHVRDGKTCYLRVINEQGYEVKNWKKDIYVVSWTRKLTDDMLQVAFFGYYLLDDVIKLPLIKSYYSTHRNKLLVLKNARPLKEIITYDN